uniref:MARVEL domain-containing protein n=1 Tax=Globodera pallida TaxID=36090 RepID=A0A183CCU8_GLOPA
MDDKSVANNNEGVANNNQSVATNNKSVAINKSQATTCCGSGSNEFGAANNQSAAINKSQATTCCGSGNNEISAINKYKYGPNNNKSGETCCCGCVSIETGTYVAAIVVCVDYIAWAIFFFYRLPGLAFFGMFILVFAFACLLVIYGQKECNPYVFVPYLIVGVIDMIFRALLLYVSFGCVFLTPVHWEYGPSYILCFCFLGYYAVSFPLYVWFYSIICRGFLAVKEVESRRYRPYF